MLASSIVIFPLILIFQISGEREPAEKPRYHLLVTVHVGKVNSGICCSSTSFESDGTLFPNGGPLRCGQQGGRICEITWSFLRRRGDADVYQLTRSDDL